MTTEPPYSEHGGLGRWGSGRSALRAERDLHRSRAFVVLVLFVVAAVALGRRRHPCPSVSGDGGHPRLTHDHRRRCHPKTSATTTTTTTHSPQFGQRRRGQRHRDQRTVRRTTPRCWPAQGWAMQDGGGRGHYRSERSSVYYARPASKRRPPPSPPRLGLKPAAVLPSDHRGSGDRRQWVTTWWWSSGADLVAPAGT